MTDREFIEWLLKQYIEKRSDVFNICMKFLETGEADKSMIESRFIQAEIPDTGIEIEYDTLTTLIHYHNPGNFWDQCINHKYVKDE